MSEPTSSIISNVIESITDSDSDGLPITAMIRGITSSESDLIRVIMEKDGTMELCG